MITENSIFDMLDLFYANKHRYMLIKGHEEAEEERRQRNKSYDNRRSKESQEGYPDSC